MRPSIIAKKAEVIGNYHSGFGGQQARPMRRGPPDPIHPRLVRHGRTRVLVHEDNPMGVAIDR